MGDRKITYRDFIYSPKYRFQSDYHNEWYNESIDHDCNIFLDKTYFMDMGGIVRLKDSNQTLGFMFKHGLVYDFEEDVLVKSYFITQLSPMEPTYVMADTFFYNKTFEHAFRPGHSNLCPTVTYCFVGEGTANMMTLEISGNHNLSAYIYM